MMRIAQNHLAGSERPGITFDFTISMPGYKPKIRLSANASAACGTHALLKPISKPPCPIPFTDAMHQMPRHGMKNTTAV